MTQFVPRSEWNDRGNPKAGYEIGKVSTVVIHHTPGQDGGGVYGTALYQVRQIRNSHIDVNGWADIGYTFLVSGDYVFEGRGFGRSGAHAPGANSSSIGIAFILDGRYREPTQVEWASAKWICDQAVQQGWLSPDYQVTGHRDWVSTECPAALVYNNLHKLKTATPEPTPPVVREEEVYQFHHRTNQYFDWPGYSENGRNQAAASDSGSVKAGDRIVAWLNGQDQRTRNITLRKPNGSTQTYVLKWGQVTVMSTDMDGFHTVIYGRDAVGAVTIEGRG